MIRKFVKITILLLIISIASILGFNNLGDTHISVNSADKSYRKGVDWLIDNEENISQEHNPMLWWMLLEAVNITGDQRLKALTDNYLKTNFRRYYETSWSKILLNRPSPINASQLLDADLPPYNLHLIYGFSCDQALANAEIIQIQNQSNFCPHHQPISPACHTHQMMAFRFMQRYRCEIPNLSTKIDSAASALQWQLRLDGRLVDVYLQRVLMLLDSGHLDQINPHWIVRALSAQGDDGGWDGFHPLIPAWSGKYLGFTARGMAFRVPHSNFHATAQGVWLSALLSKNRGSLLIPES